MEKITTIIIKFGKGCMWICAAVPELPRWAGAIVQWLVVCTAGVQRQMWSFTWQVCGNAHCQSLLASCIMHSQHYMVMIDLFFEWSTWTLRVAIFRLSSQSLSRWIWEKMLIESREEGSKEWSDSIQCLCSSLRKQELYSLTETLK